MIVARSVLAAVLGAAICVTVAGAAEPPTRAALELSERLRALERTYLRSEKGRDKFHTEGEIQIEADGGTVRVLVPKPRLGPRGEGRRRRPAPGW